MKHTNFDDFDINFKNEEVLQKSKKSTANFEDFSLGEQKPKAPSFSVKNITKNVDKFSAVEAVKNDITPIEASSNSNSSDIDVSFSKTLTSPTRSSNIISEIETVNSVYTSYEKATDTDADVLNDDYNEPTEAEIQEDLSEESYYKNIINSTNELSDYSYIADSSEDTTLYDFSEDSSKITYTENNYSSEIDSSEQEEIDNEDDYNLTEDDSLDSNSLDVNDVEAATDSDDSDSNENTSTQSKTSAFPEAKNVPAMTFVPKVHLEDISESPALPGSDVTVDTVSWSSKMNFSNKYTERAKASLNHNEAANTNKANSTDDDLYDVKFCNFSMMAKVKNENSKNTVKKK